MRKVCKNFPFKGIIRQDLYLQPESTANFIRDFASNGVVCRHDFPNEADFAYVWRRGTNQFSIVKI